MCIRILSKWYFLARHENNYIKVITGIGRVFHTIWYSRKTILELRNILGNKWNYILLGTLTKPNVGEHTQDTTREFQWRQTNCACAFYCVKGQYIVFQPTTTAICRTCTVVIKRYGLPLVAFTDIKLWQDSPLEILPVAPGHQQPPNIGILPRDCWWTVATLDVPGIPNKLFQH